MSLRLITIAISMLPLTVFANTSESVDLLARDFIHQYHVPGMSIAVIKNDQIRYYNYGYADEIKKRPITNKTIYTIASFTKTFTATLAAIAVAEERLDLDSPCTEYLPLVHNKFLSQISTSQLLGHVSGLPFDFQPRPINMTEAMAMLTQFKPTDSPATQYGYSNAGIGTVGFILENAYEDTYINILSKKLLLPLDMNSTYLTLPSTAKKYLAVGHDGDNQRVNPTSELAVWFAAASLKSTIVDMAKYVQYHMTNGAHTDKTLTKAASLVHTNRYCFTNDLACEQLSWQAHMISELPHDEGDTYFSHFDEHDFPIFTKQAVVTYDTLNGKSVFIDKTESGYGMSGYMAYIPEKQIGVVILTNKFLGNERIRLGRDILQII